MSITHYFRTPALSNTKKSDLLSAVRLEISSKIEDIKTEYCFNIDASGPITDDNLKISPALQLIEDRSFLCLTGRVYESNV